MDSVIDRFINYILLTNNITINILQDSNNKQLYDYVYKTLKHLNTKCYELITIRKRREEIRDDIDDLERAYVTADSLDINEGGYNNGGKPNQVELRLIKIRELKEQLGELINKTMLLEKSLVDNKEMVAKIFDLLLKDDDRSKENKATVMKLYYIDCFSVSKIAIELFYERDSIRKIKSRAIYEIAIEIKKYLAKK